MEEISFYQSNSVSVTQSRFIVGNKTFAMRNISSVQIGLIPANRTWGYIIVLIGLVIALSNDMRPLGIIIIIIGCAYAYIQKDIFTVRISTNSGESDSLISKDKEYIQTIVNALNDA